MFDQIAITAIIISVLILFIWGKWRYDIVALMALGSCALFGLVPVDDIFSGFGHPATITVAIVLILSYGLTKSGVIERIAKIIDPISSIPSLHIAALIFIAAFLSMFMNNVGALALLMPVAIQSTLKAGRSPATVLMPLSFGSILGGLVTLIGTPPNIIIASYREEIIGESFDMFDFAPAGGVITLVGLLFLVFIGWRLVKVRKSSSQEEGLFDIADYLFEVKITKKSYLVGMMDGELEKILHKNNINLISLINKRQKYTIVPKSYKFNEGDILVLESSQKDIDKFASQYNLSLLSAENARDAILHSKDTITMEVVVSPDSKVDGRTVENIRFKSHLGVNLLAVSRQGMSYSQRLRKFRFKTGDVILIHGEEDAVEQAVSKIGCYPLAKRQLGFGKRKLAIPATFIFIASLALGVSEIIPIQIALGMGVIAMALANIIPVRELYNGVDWPVIVLLGAMIPVGSALESSGATRVISNFLLDISYGYSPAFMIAAILIITMTLSDILNNATTAILMAPIAKNIALGIGASIDPFLMAVAIGASCAFLTPIGHQNNALVLGPGGYHFSDYWRVGLWLEILIILIAVPTIMHVWPLYSYNFNY
ncbi:SLC13 family permease [Rickettsiales bacterium]|nr:SLC13 family permease [Rickettsiales bacterium]